MSEDGPLFPAVVQLKLEREPDYSFIFTTAGKRVGSNFQPHQRIGESKLMCNICPHIRPQLAKHPHVLHLTHQPLAGSRSCRHGSGVCCGSKWS